MPVTKYSFGVAALRYTSSGNPELLLVCRRHSIAMCEILYGVTPINPGLLHRLCQGLTHLERTTLLSKPLRFSSSSCLGVRATTAATSKKNDWSGARTSSGGESRPFERVRSCDVSSPRPASRLRHPNGRFQRGDVRRRTRVRSTPPAESLRRRADTPRRSTSCIATSTSSSSRSTCPTTAYGTTTPTSSEWCGRGVAPLRPAGGGPV